MDRARLRSLFPESWAGASAPEDHPGRESPTPRQMAELGKGQGRSTHLPPASPHSDCHPPHRGLDTTSVAVLTWEGWRESGERGRGLGEPGRMRQHNGTGRVPFNYVLAH